jgi:Fe-S cluster biogenesis protein NfuA
MFIQTQETPNPQSLMFLPGRAVLDDGMTPVAFSKEDTCEHSPFAKRLLSFDGIEGVFFGADFITLTKNEKFEWFSLKPHVLGVIMEQFVNHLPVILREENIEEGCDENQDPLFKTLQELIDTRVRPAVANDGGDIILKKFEDGIVYLKMKGACSGCPSSSVTLKSGIENMLKFYVPEVIEVRQIDD